MSASKLNPNIYQGEERATGILSKNTKPTSANSPDYKGRIYLAGIGWYWLSGWLKEAQFGEYLRLDVQEMTDEQATKYCKPKPSKRETPAAELPHREHASPALNGSERAENDIPF